MIDIFNIDGSVLFSAPTTEEAVFHEELMVSDYVQLTWNSNEGTVLPVGAYIDYDGEQYRLLEPYKPQQVNEVGYKYTPQFQSRIMSWDKQITPVYTYEEDGTTVKTREMDWTFTGSPVDAMYIIKQAIKNETGEVWNVQLASELPATINIQSKSSSIFSVLNTIANECDTEWWADKKTNMLYLSKCVHGEPVTLEVGENIQVPSVTNSGEGYFTRFYAFGSTRNIVQSSTEGNASVNKRLTLDPAKYPNGYKDIRQGLKQNEIFVKVLYFDNIYPSSKLTISDVRARLRYRLDNSGNKIKIGGTDEEPIYEQYAIWYFQIAGFDFNPDTIIEGLNLSASFESGQLAGRDFELTYYKEGRKVSDNNDVTPFEIKAGDYEIIIDETSGQIIPGVAYIIPQEGDSVVLYNIEMPAEYTSSAQAELEAELDKAMASYKEDNNTYQMSSDPTRFYSEETDIKMGQAITFINGLQTLSTRAMMVEKRLDLPCYQTIKVGNKIIKGKTQELKEEVANANQSIDVINAFNELSKSLSQAYANAQREMIEGFTRIGNMWKFDTENENTIYTEFNAYSKGELAAGGFSAGGGGGETGGGGIDENKLWQILAKEGTQQINKSHITTALTGYATEQWVLQKGYITSAALNGYATQEWVTNNFVTAEKLTEQLKKYVTLEVFNPFKETVDAHISNNNIHLTAEEKEKLSWFAKDKAGNIYVTNGLNFYTEGELSAGGFSDEGGSGTGGLFGIKVNGQTYTPENGYITIPDYPTSLTWANITGKPSWIGNTKPSYTFAEITSKPTTLAGYGIKDAYIQNGTIVLGSNNITPLTSSNYSGTLDSRYVKKSGDTMTGALTVPSLAVSGSTATVSGNKVWHAGNDGSGSGLDADTLDGTHKSGLFTSLTNSGNNISMTIGGTTKTLTPAYASKTGALNNYGRTSNLDDIRINGLVSWGSDATSKPANNGTVFQFSNVSSPVPGTNQHCVNQIAYSTSINRIYTRQRINTGSWTAWETIAYTNDNVASATKLQTARTIWGQSFDGTGNVSGNLITVGQILFSEDGKIQCSSDGYIGFANRAGSISLPIKAHSLILADYLNTTSSYRLHVAGTFYASGAATLGSTLNVSGLVTATAGLTTPQYIQIGKGRIYWDEANNALYVKSSDGSSAINFYSLGELSAGGYEEGSGEDVGNIFGIKVNGQTYTPENGYITIPDYPTSLTWANITGKPSWIGNTKPSYTFAEITSKPTTLAGYGIKDAYIQNGTIVLGSNNITPLTSSNYSGTLDSRYVKKSGDTMTGALTVPSLAVSGSTATVSGNKVWHAGNDGSGSGLDADTLDGTHKSGLFTSLTNSGNNISMTIGGTTKTLTPAYASKTGALNNYGRTSNLDDIRINGLVSWGSDATSKPANNGTVFQFSNVSSPVPGTNQHCVNQIAYSTSINRIYTRQRINTGSWTAWETIAYTNDNVASATKLQTARTIWGQSFDGTGNVRGRFELTGTYQGALSIYGEDLSYRAIQTWGGAPLCLNPVGNNVAIGATFSDYELYVNGTVGVGSSITVFDVLTAHGGIITNYCYTKWIGMATRSNIIQGDQNQKSDSAHALYRVKNSNGDAIVFGGLGVNTGFYGFTASRISSEENGYDWATTWNVGTGDITHNKAMTIGGRLSANGGIYTTDISGNGSALYLGNSNNRSYVYLREDMKANSGSWSIATSGAAAFSSLTINGAASFSSLSVSGASTFTGKTTHNGGIASTYATLSSYLKVNGQSTFNASVGIKTSPISSYSLAVSGNTYQQGDSYLVGSKYINGIRVYKDSDGYLCIQGNLKITGNVAAAGEVAAGQTLTGLTDFLYDVTSFDSYSSTATNRAPTARAVKLIKDKVSSVSSTASSVNKKMNSINTYLSQITSSTTLDQLKTILMNLANAI